MTIQDQTTQDQTTEQNQSSMEELLKQNKNSFQLYKKGDVVEGKIIDISPNAVYVDLDGRATGIIRGRELIDEGNVYKNLEPGVIIKATIVDLENENGEVELSIRETSHQKTWQELEKLRQEDNTVEVKILDANKGGLIISLNHIQGFLPTSQLSAENYPRVDGGNKDKILEKLKSMVGQKIKTKIIGLDEVENKLIVSEKATTKQKLQEKMANYKIGDIVEGKISGIVDFGVFVKFEDNLEGLVHLSELAWQRIGHPKDLFKVGDKVKAEIISIDDAKISLSIKNLIEDPWKKVAEKYKIGNKVKGKVLKLEPFGLFVELDPDIHGLCHISETNNQSTHEMKNDIQLGDELDFEIVSLEPQEHRLGLSLKQKSGKIKAGDKKAKNPSTETTDEESPREEESGEENLESNEETKK
ncbi:MAG: S1 RNA-binding domain-containing protein [Patescibacteria group bacterium]|jgi:ribosomal protein S1|nr:S1 RNA-binding domain-containing protein [Patescibacteria group bacterium]